MYYFFEQASVGGQVIEQIMKPLGNGGVMSFPNVDSNEGPDRAAYLEWLAEGNTPEPWPPNEGAV